MAVLKKIPLRRLTYVIADVASIIIAQALALILRFWTIGMNIPDFYVQNVASWFSVINIITTLVIFSVFKMYSHIWKSASVMEMADLIFSVTISCIVHTGGFIAWGKYVLNTDSQIMPISYFLFYFGFLAVFVFISRFSRRVLKTFRDFYMPKLLTEKKTVMIVGAGSAGQTLIKELRSSEYVKCKVACFVDDDKSKLGHYINGCKVEGTREDIPSLVEKHGITDIYVAMPSVNPKEISAVLEICKETGAKMKILPGLYQFVNDEVIASKFRDVAIEDLLGRDPIVIDSKLVMDSIKDKVVLVTGGGGSIGSELCRQIAQNNPKQLIIVDIYENNAYDIQQELLRTYPYLNLKVLIGSVRNTLRINKIFETYRPQIVYHAAAHKHVPLMEESPNEAIKNNVFGTLKTVKAAHQWGVERFVLISTDKAVNPTNIMGATKRLCEMIVQMYSRRSKTEYVAVRFGNVLGSNGSVIPLFKKQIAQGGPVKVTHPDIIRYFMTIPEAVSLVLQAGAYAKGGEIFVLDMGAPVKILDLAKNLIKLSGYTPDKDIKIEFTGLRPGEKLYEELLMDEEGLKETDNKLIHIGKPIEFDDEEFEKQLDSLYEAVLKEPEDAKKMIANMVSTYHPAN